MMLGEQPVDHDGRLSFKDDPVKRNLGIADGKDIPQIAWSTNNWRGRKDGLLKLNEIPDLSRYDAMADSGLAGGNLQRNLPKPVGVPGHVGTNQLLKHLRGGHT
jgi:hypothetical protein